MLIDGTVQETENPSLSIHLLPNAKSRVTSHILAVHCDHAFLVHAHRRTDPPR